MRTQLSWNCYCEANVQHKMAGARILKCSRLAVAPQVKRVHLPNDTSLCGGNHSPTSSQCGWRYGGLDTTAPRGVCSCKAELRSCLNAWGWTKLVPGHDYLLHMALTVTIEFAGLGRKKYLQLSCNCRHESSPIVLQSDCGGVSLDAEPARSI